MERQEEKQGVDIEVQEREDDGWMRVVTVEVSLILPHKGLSITKSQGAKPEMETFIAILVKLI